jgi:4-amino-4-deoxy-L-arabinose transferase-like glycosyltransferase
MRALALRRRIRGIGSWRTGVRWPQIAPEARWVWLGVVLFVAMSAWWLTQDTRVPDYDSGLHMYYAVVAHGELQLGQFWRPFTDFNTYPPLVHMVGGVAQFVTGLHPMAFILSSNVVFVPLLAFGCYGVGRITYGPRAGLLAAVLALGTPMFVSMMHEYDLDPPQAAMVAISVWAVLASRRFERVWIAALAGALSGLALLTKQTSVIFLAGLVGVSVLRAGPRRWRGVLAFFVALAVIAAPWYVYHWHELRRTFSTIGGQAGLPANSLQTPPHFSLRSFAWYWWNLVNEQVLLPFTLAFLVGAVLAIRRIVRERFKPQNFEPELLAGVIVSYLGMTYLTHKDPRYTLPMLVYVAVLATGWITMLRRPRWRIGLSTAVVVLAIVYFVGMSVGIGGAVRVKLPGSQENIIYPGQLTLYETTGWVRGGPVQDGNVSAILSYLKQSGVKGVIFDTGSDPIDFNHFGLPILAMAQGLGFNMDPPLPLSEQAYVILHQPGGQGPAPCQTLQDGSQIYVVRAAPGLDAGPLRNPTNPAQTYTFLCPGRAPLISP